MHFQPSFALMLDVRKKQIKKKH